MRHPFQISGVRAHAAVATRRVCVADLTALHRHNLYSLGFPKCCHLLHRVMHRFKVACAIMLPRSCKCFEQHILKDTPPSIAIEVQLTQVRTATDKLISM